MVAAYQQALYATNSATNRFCDSKGFDILKKAAYEVQRDFSRELIADDMDWQF